MSCVEHMSWLSVQQMHMFPYVTTDSRPHSVGHTISFLLLETFEALHRGCLCARRLLRVVFVGWLDSFVSVFWCGPSAAAWQG